LPSDLENSLEAQIYKKMYHVEDSLWWYVAKRKIVLSALAHLNSQKIDLKVLEIGCGTGGNLKFFSKYFKKSIWLRT
jgi:hypothetical protein